MEMAGALVQWITMQPVTPYSSGLFLYSGRNKMFLLRSKVENVYCGELCDREAVHSASDRFRFDVLKMLTLFVGPSVGSISGQRPWGWPKSDPTMGQHSCWLNDFLTFIVTFDIWMDDLTFCKTLVVHHPTNHWASYKRRQWEVSPRDWSVTTVIRMHVESVLILVRRDCSIYMRDFTWLTSVHLPVDKPHPATTIDETSKNPGLCNHGLSSVVN